ncbi:MAG: hypothetical protein ABSC94_04850 [Polyangiaceae bacterium]|jgi:tetratricopeptide (TPR) repeat protein
MKFTRLRPVLCLLVLTIAVVAPTSSRAQTSTLARAVETLIAGLDFDDARAMLAGAAAVAPDDPRMALERARLAIDELDCDGAASILARPEVQKVDRDTALGDIARGCQRVTAATVVRRDEERQIEVRFQDEHDAPLAPLIFETVARARDALSRDLGVSWPLPTRLVVVRDLLSLAAMTGLPYDSARTTGTVAVAKWGRVTLLSPRAARHGYPWRDTIAHELTHLAVTRATRDLAPLWLQEGVAKRQEVRWRDPGPFDDRPSPEALVEQGMARGLTLPLDKLGPSIAMLPSADAATVAFAEVTSFVGYYLESVGRDALPRLLHELRTGKDSNAALLATSGADLKAWDIRWRASIEARSRIAVPALGGGMADRGGMRDVRDRSRLAQLLLSRDHADAAIDELSEISLGAARTISSDAGFRWLRARAYEMAGRPAEGAPLVAEPRDVSSSYGPWWALRGRWARERGDEDEAIESFGEALAVDPLESEVACEGATVDAAPREPSLEPLCEAARGRPESPLDDFE